jgi:Domain of unknown function (DUF4276)
VVDKVIAPYLSGRGFAISVSKLGGVAKWPRIARDIKTLLRNPALDVLTTIIDYYGLPPGTPGMSDRPSASGGRQLGELRGKPTLTTSLLREVDRAGGAELINDSPQTAPSNRLLRLCPDYNKVSEGPAAIAALGLEALRCVCPHLDAWLIAWTRTSIEVTG